MIKQKAFTLIELLVIIAIIGTLAGIVIVNVSDSRKKSRDTRRVADMKQIMTAEELYYDKYTKYVDTVDGGQPVAWQLKELSKMLNEAGLVNQTSDNPIKDPSITDNYYYFLWKEGGDAGEGACSPAGSSKGNYYVLGVYNMETSNGTAYPGSYPGSPGVSCGGLKNSFEWGVNKFEK